MTYSLRDSAADKLGSLTPSLIAMSAEVEVPLVWPAEAAGYAVAATLWSNHDESVSRNADETSEIELTSENVRDTLADLRVGESKVRVHVMDATQLAIEMDAPTLQNNLHWVGNGRLVRVADVPDRIAIAGTRAGLDGVLWNTVTMTGIALQLTDGGTRLRLQRVGAPVELAKFVLPLPPVLWDEIWPDHRADPDLLEDIQERIQNATSRWQLAMACHLGRTYIPELWSTCEAWWAQCSVRTAWRANLLQWTTFFVDRVTALLNIADEQGATWQHFMALAEERAGIQALQSLLRDEDVMVMLEAADVDMETFLEHCPIRDRECVAQSSSLLRSEWAAGLEQDLPALPWWCDFDRLNDNLE